MTTPTDPNTPQTDLIADEPLDKLVAEEEWYRARYTEASRRRALKEAQAQPAEETVDVLKMSPAEYAEHKRRVHRMG